MTVLEQAQQISNNLHTIEIKDGSTRIVWEDEAPEDLREWFQNTTADSTGYSFNELDECYRVLDTLCDIIIDLGAYNETGEDLTHDQIENAIYDHEWADIYNADLLDWVKDNLGRGEDVNEALREGASELYPAIQQAQDRTRSGYALEFLAAIEKRVS